MRQRVYTAGEVVRMLPLVAAIVAEAREAAREGSIAARTPGEGMPEMAVRRLADLRRCTRELEALGAFLRDADAGTVEWYGSLDGEVVFLSWKPGEAGVGFWRALQGPPAERRPLPAAAFATGKA
jgi:hypothetical protein